MSFHKHLRIYEDLITPYDQIRSGFISLALEKNKKATPFIEEAKALKVLASRAKDPKELLTINNINDALLTAAGISGKARNHLRESDKQEAIRNLLENFLEPSGNSFIDELVYRFLLTRGDALGGKIRNLAGALGLWGFTRVFISTCSVRGLNLQYLDIKSQHWMAYNFEPEIEKQVKGLHWISDHHERTLIYNLTVPTVKKNVDLCLLNTSPQDIILDKNKDSAHHQPENYLALGELKGGIDPAGADEHWKTANSALGRIRKAFSDQNCYPKMFFIGAAIADHMAQEIYQQLNDRILSNAANLTNEEQVVSLCDWLLNL